MRVSSGAQRVRSLYITHAHRPNNASANGRFHNTITCRQEGVMLSQETKFVRCGARLTVGLFILAAWGGSDGAVAATRRSGRPGRVQTGLDVLEVQKFAALRNKHVGLITNHTGLDSEGRSIAELISHAPGVHLVALFSPEHGLAGRNDEKIASNKDAQTGLPIFSLYG